MKKQSLLKASLILGIAGIISKFLGLFFRWPLIMLIGDEGVGYYQMSYPLYMFLWQLHQVCQQLYLKWYQKEMQREI